MRASLGLVIVCNASKHLHSCAQRVERVQSHVNRRAGASATDERQREGNLVSIRALVRHDEQVTTACASVLDRSLDQKKIIAQKSSKDSVACAAQVSRAGLALVRLRPSRPQLPPLERVRRGGTGCLQRAPPLGRPHRALPRPPAWRA